MQRLNKVLTYVYARSEGGYRNLGHDHGSLDDNRACDARAHAVTGQVLGVFPCIWRDVWLMFRRCSRWTCHVSRRGWCTTWMIRATIGRLSLIV